MTSTNSSVGIDLVEIADLKQRLSEKLVHRILSPNEQKRYDNIVHERRKLEFLAGRLAAKEAYAKAYKLFEETLNFTDVDITADDNGAPVLRSIYRPHDIVRVSISHTKHYAVAIVLVDMAYEERK